jgi:hypothetical protein
MGTGLVSPQHVGDLILRFLFFLVILTLDITVHIALRAVVGNKLM